MIVDLLGGVEPTCASSTTAAAALTMKIEELTSGLDNVLFGLTRLLEGGLGLDGTLLKLLLLLLLLCLLLMRMMMTIARSIGRAGRLYGRASGRFGHGRAERRRRR